MKHLELASGRWYKLNLIEQLANIGSEIERSIVAKERGLSSRFTVAAERGLELFDLTLAGKNLSPAARREVARARELTVDWLYGSNYYHTTPELWQRYFRPFMVAARSKSMR